jgi:hypothetical protein
MADFLFKQYDNVEIPLNCHPKKIAILKSKVPGYVASDNSMK